MTKATCSVDGCEKPAIARRLCPMHLWRLNNHGDVNYVRPAVTAADRFWAKVEKNGSVPPTRPELGACWVWTAYRSQSGYGMFTVKSRGPDRLTISAHRYAWLLVGGSLDGPDDELDHLCHDPTVCSLGDECPHRGCVNPTHLERVTPQQNVLRSGSLAAMHAKKTHCSQGHPYSGDNLRHNPDGSRRCNECNRITQRAIKQRRRERRQESASLVTYTSVMPGDEPSYAPS